MATVVRKKTNGSSRGAARLPNSLGREESKMPHDLSHAPVWKQSKRATTRMLIISTPIQWYQHWIDGRSYICPGDGCIACAAWLPTSHKGALALIKKNGEAVWLQSSNAAWRETNDEILPGDIVEVTRPDKVTTIATTGASADWETYDASVSWSVIATMNRLPLPPIALYDALVDLRAAARRQIIAALPILAQDVNDAEE